MSVVRLTWRVGVDNEFGWLLSPDGSRQLCESRLFWDGAILVSLETGETVLAPADGSYRWRSLKPEAACAIVGIPAPEVDGAAEVDRRLDPFHVERHRSARFCALVELINEHRLPCGYALYDHEPGRREGRGPLGVCDESAEMFAASVAERIARGCGLNDAIRAELAGDADIDPDDPAAVERLLGQIGWASALPELDLRIRRHERRIEAAQRHPRGPDEQADDGQLALI